MTCAHRYYPFGTLLKVKNLSNGKEVIVKVTDRGPYGRNRIIDLSYGAAKKLGMLSQGIAMVEVKRVDGIVPPYRDDGEDGETGLPDFEFNINEVGYSFINDWTNDKEHTAENLPERKLPTKAQAKAKRQSIKAKADLRAAMNAHKEKDNDEKNVSQGNSNAQKQNSKGKNEGESSTWRNVFEKIKNWWNK
jgi:rare lipoprotein A